MAPYAHWRPPTWFEKSDHDRWWLARAELHVHKRSVERLFPGFRLVLDVSWGCVWRGILQPAAQPYEVLVSYFPGVLGSELEYLAQPPRVFLLSPAPERRPAAPDTPIPHLYRQPLPEQPAHLCLYHPSSAEWKWSDWIGETILPWAAEWLAFYEMWRITGSWEGPEKHPDLGAIKTDQLKAPVRAVRRLAAGRWLDRPLLASLHYALSRENVWGPSLLWTVDAIKALAALEATEAASSIAAVRGLAPSELTCGESSYA